jgi:uncharacterized membrane protein (DUF485 family)
MTDLKTLAPKNGKKTQLVEKKGSGWVNLVVWFLVVSILSYVILYTWNPTLLQTTDASGKPTGVSNPTTTIISSIVIGLIIAAIIFFIRK